MDVFHHQNQMYEPGDNAPCRLAPGAEWITTKEEETGGTYVPFFSRPSTDALPRRQSRRSASPKVFDFFASIIRLLVDKFGAKADYYSFTSGNHGLYKVFKEC